MYAPNIPIYCSLAIKNLRTEPLLFLFSKNYKLYFHIHFINLPYFLCTCNKCKLFLISNFYKNRRRLKHMYLKYMPINKTNKSVILTSISQRSLGKNTVSPGHSLLAHHRNKVNRDSDKNEDL